MPTDIFPDIDIPVLSGNFQLRRPPPEEMEKRIVNNYERFLTTTVNDIDHIESQSLTGISIIKIFLQPGASIEAATAQVTAISQTAIRQMPPGISPPLIIRYSASNVPILQAALESESLSEQQLFDYAVNFIRADIATIRGTQIPYPYGGKQRQSHGRHRPAAPLRLGLSPRDVNAALGPAERHPALRHARRWGRTSTPSSLNSSPAAFEELGEAAAQDGERQDRLPSATSRACATGARRRRTWCTWRASAAVLLSILKNGSAEHARRRLAHPRDAAGHAGEAPEGAQGLAALRSVGVRPRRGLRGRARGADRRGAHGADDRAVPRELAQHAHRRHQHPALDPRLDHRAERASARRST